ncbi:MAG: UvrD-helicase domain-containing protein [Planctomycetota bacterium]
MKLTDEQSAAAFATEPSVAVVAGAGTGKTRVLTSRYMHLVFDRNVPVSRILSLTFTEKAAREMKERIRDALNDRDRRDLAHDMEFAPVSTIHAFLASILRERALDAGLDPRFAIADEITAQIYLEESVRRTLDTIDPAHRSALVELPGGEDALTSLYLAACATPHAMSELSLAPYDEEELRTRLRRFFDACSSHTATAKTGEKLAALARLAPRVIELDRDAAVDFKAATSGGVAAAQRDLFREGRELAKEYAKLDLLAVARALGDAVVEALTLLDHLYTERKRAEGLLDFADLEREGLKLLRSPAGALVAAEFDHVLVDEYQDTSRIQQAILDLLAEGRDRFGVGDQKQSIYRFRYADVGVFQDLQETSARYPLGGSFRSRPELVSFNNEFFRGPFEATDVEPQDLHAAADWRDVEGGPSRVEVIAIEAPRSAEGRRLEAVALARRLRDIVNGGELPISREDEEPEPLRYGDCALLLRAMSNLHVYERAFTDAGIPYVVIQGRGYYAAREVVDLAHLLMLLADPFDNYRAVSALTSLFCGVPDADIVHLKAASSKAPLPLRAATLERPEAIPEPRWDRLRKFAARFREWQDLAGRTETGDLVERIFADTRFPELMLLESDGRRRFANLMKVLRRARQTHEGPVTYARSLLEFRDRELRESEAPIAGENDDAVQIMTIHASKGLEFPLVAVADLNAGVRGGSGPILRGDGQFGLRLRAEGRVPTEPPGFAALKEWDHAQDEAESLRLYYVAFTRAQEHMILSGTLKPRKSDGTRAATERFLGDLVDRPPAGVRIHDVAPLLQKLERGRSRAAVRAALRRGAELPAGVTRDEDAAAAVLNRIASIPVRTRDTTPYVAAAADLVEFKRCPRRYRLRRMLGIEYDDSEALNEGHEPADADEHPRRLQGTAFHEVMEEIGPGAVPDTETVRRHWSEARDTDVRKIIEWAEWLAEQPLARELKETTQHREMPFLTKVGPLPVRGVIDLYAPDLPLLLDYKTGSRVRATEYAVQIGLYLAAVRELGFDPPARGHLVYVDAQQIVEVKAEPVEVLVERFLEAHRAPDDSGAAGAFGPEPGPACIHCEFQRACVSEGVACPTGEGRRGVKGQLRFDL